MLSRVEVRSLSKAIFQKSEEKSASSRTAQEKGFTSPEKGEIRHTTSEKKATSLEESRKRGGPLSPKGKKTCLLSSHLGEGALLIPKPISIRTARKKGIKTEKTPAEEWLLGEAKFL